MAASAAVISRFASSARIALPCAHSMFGDHGVFAQQRSLLFECLFAAVGTARACQMANLFWVLHAQCLVISLDLHGGSWALDWHPTVIWLDYSRTIHQAWI